MKASQLFGITVLGKDKKKRGYVLAVSCAGNKIEGYVCCDESENEFFAESAGVKFTQESMHFSITGKENKNCRRLRLGRAVYTQDGKFLGCAEDFIIKGDRITHAQVGKRKIPFEKLTCGDVYILSDERTRAEIAAKDMLIDNILSAT